MAVVEEKRMTHQLGAKTLPLVVASHVDLGGAGVLRPEEDEVVEGVDDMKRILLEEAQDNMRLPVEEVQDDMRLPVEEAQDDMRLPVEEAQDDMRLPVEEAQDDMRLPVEEDEEDMSTRRAVEALNTTRDEVEEDKVEKEEVEGVVVELPPSALSKGPTNREDQLRALSPSRVCSCGDFL